MYIDIKDPVTLYRVLVVALLVFGESFLIPLQTRLATGSFPSNVELTSYLVTGLLQAVTLLLAFLRKETNDTVKSEKNPN
jgi:hypothetical protein